MKEKDQYTKRDMIISVIIAIGICLIFMFGNFLWDKVSCKYKGYTYEKLTKRPIFSECLVQMKDGSYVPLDRYINRTITINDLGGDAQ